MILIDDELTSFVDEVAVMQGEHRNLKFAGDYALVKEYGKVYTPPESIVSNELLMKERGVDPGDLKDCFMNAARAVVMDFVDLTYVEGFAISGGSLRLPVHHAWLVTDDGQVIDPTWGQHAAMIVEEYRGGDLDEPSDTTPGVLYYGIPFTQKALQASMLENEIWGMLGHWNSDFWKDGIPDEG